MTGSVRWFRDDKGYGFITPDEGGKDIFVHFSHIVGRGRKTLIDGQRVEYDPQETPRGLQATQVRTVEVA
ncbi:MAG: cold-shock protein [Acidobacteriota bacterium]|nr:cold-shock protein [Acidobacteriota bacterium]